ncbi:hypothetical protein, partial [Escherichia coli]|uniref:hypothetical protein n=1 Tax=Escherichia coli TaxID=562 RepID=UPI0021CF8DE7
MKKKTIAYTPVFVQTLLCYFSLPTISRLFCFSFSVHRLFPVSSTHLLSPDKSQDILFRLVVST